MQHTTATRDATAAAQLALTQWVEWLPGDGTSYRVRVVTIVGGPDRCDRVLLVNSPGQTLAFQFATVAYRHLENERWSKRRCAAEGMPAWAWNAAGPLLAEFGVTSKRFGHSATNIGRSDRSVRTRGHSAEGSQQ